MSKFSKESKDLLATCDPNLQKLFNEVIKYFDCKVLEGHRSTERQLQLYKEGKTRVKFGKHNEFPSLAVDIAPYPVSWKDLSRFYYFAGFAMGIARSMNLKIRWGGDWDSDTDLHDQEFNDLVHFELIK